MQKFISGSLLLAGLPFFVHAERAFASDAETLPETVVTATRSEIDKNELATASTVYTRKDIERLQAKTVPELLRGTTGLDLTQQGGDGKTTSVFMRGTNSSHLLVLIDGIKVGSATLGSTAFEFLPIDQIERVEIIRGPQSSLYGSEAIGGVIQIFTRKGSRTQKPSVTLDAGGGNYGTLRSAGTLSGEIDNTWYSVGASHYNTEGFNACENKGACLGGFGNEPDQDGYYNTGLNARLGHRFANNAEVDASFMRSQGRSEYDGFVDKSKFRNQVAALSGSLYLSDDWKSTLRLGQSLDYGDNYLPGGNFFSRFNTTRWNATWLNQLTLSENHQLILGSDYRLDEVDGTTAYVKKSRYDVGIFGEWHGRLWDEHFFNASLRWDENEAFGDYVTGNFGWRYNSPLGISPFASFGNAFKAPTFNDLYYPSSGFNFGGFSYRSFANPNLSPEQSTSFEVGVAGNHFGLQWELRAYHTNIDDLILWQSRRPNPATSELSPQNVAKAQIDGLEAEIGGQLLGWNHKLNMSLLSPRDRETNQRLIRRAEQNLSYDLSKSFGNVDIGAFVLARGTSSDQVSGQRTTIPGFATVDLRAAYHINKNWTLNAKLNNLLDKQYQLVDTYFTADRNFFVSIHYNN